MKYLPRSRAYVVIACFLLCALASESAKSQGVSVRDMGLRSQFQDTTLGHHKRGRANVAADFDLDGYVDFFMGNPGDESIVLRAVPSPSGKVRYKLEQVLLTGALAWSATSFDYDNDGDYDIFVGCGGNEGRELDYLFRNDWIVDGQVAGRLSFTDVTAQAGIAGPIPDGAPRPVRTASAGVAAVDYDRDGNTDIFVSGNNIEVQEFPELTGRNTLWRNNGDGTFTDVSVASGLGVILAATRHSTFFDFDNDGDQDLFENNYHDANRLWRNDGNGGFTDVTADMSAPGHDLSFPSGSFASAAADFNNDDWEDLIVWMRGSDHLVGSPYEDGHAIFINHGGTEFENVSPSANINEFYVANPNEGVMGCQVGDVNGDGIPDIYVGNGGPPSGVADQLFLSIGLNVGVPVFTNSSSLIDFPAVIPAGMPVPPYPYRTHGTTIADADNDGTTEIMVSNGGPSGQPDSIREPNRMFKFDFEYGYLRFHLIGDGVAVSKDAIGSHVAVTVSNAEEENWRVHKTLHGGSAFSAHNGFDLHFGLGDAQTIENVEIIWPDGRRGSIVEKISLNSSVTVEYQDGMAVLKELHESALTKSQLSKDESDLTVRPNYPNPFNPTTTIRYTLKNDSHVLVGVYDVLGREVALLVDGFQSAGDRSVTWEGNGGDGKPVSSGLYFYRIVAGEHSEFHRMMLMK